MKRIWHDLLGDQFLTRPRLSRIYFDGQYFDYPLKAANALGQLGMVKAVRMALSYGWARLRPIRPEVSFEDWVVNRFGRELYETFFKAYTEKVWGIPCSTIGAQWAAQRIKGLSLWVAAREMLLTPFRRGQVEPSAEPDRAVRVPPARARPAVGGCARSGASQWRRGPPELVR